jgi:hypothetical protein
MKIGHAPNHRLRCAPSTPCSGVPRTARWLDAQRATGNQLKIILERQTRNDYYGPLFGQMQLRTCPSTVQSLAKGTH